MSEKSSNSDGHTENNKEKCEKEAGSSPPTENIHSVKDPPKTELEAKPQLSECRDTQITEKPKPPIPEPNIPKEQIPELPRESKKPNILLSWLCKSILSLESSMKSVSKGSPGMSSDVAKTGRRPMRFPYTFTAKIAQFPIKFHLNNTWLYKYYLIGVVVSFPVFYKIGKLSNSPENVATWEEIRRREFTPGGHH